MFTTKGKAMQVGLVKASKYPLMEELISYRICYPDGFIAGTVEITGYVLSFNVRLVNGSQFTNVLTYNKPNSFNYRRLIVLILKELGFSPQFNDPIEQAILEEDDDGEDLYSN